VPIKYTVYVAGSKRNLGVNDEQNYAKPTCELSLLIRKMNKINLKKISRYFGA